MIAGAATCLGRARPAARVKRETMSSTHERAQPERLTREAAKPRPRYHRRDATSLPDSFLSCPHLGALLVPLTQDDASRYGEVRLQLDVEAFAVLMRPSA